MGYSQRDCQNGRNRAAAAKMAGRANIMPQKTFFNRFFLFDIQVSFGKIPI
jgi:hypothetical protein